MGKKKKIKDAFSKEIVYEKLGTDNVKERKQGNTKIDIVSFDAIDWLISQLENRLEDSWDNIVMITGQERSGKSTLGFHIFEKLAERLGKEFTVDNIYFSAYELYRDAKKGNKRDIFMLDEAGAELYGKEWYTEVQKSIVKLLQVIGKKELTIILNLPHRTLLNKDIRNRRIHYWFHTAIKKEMVDGVLKRKRGYAKLREPYTNEWSDSAFWKAKFTIKYPKYEGEVWDEYEKKKTKYIENMTAGHITKYQQKLYTTIYSLKELGDADVQTLLKYIPYSETRIYDIALEVKNNEELLESVKQELGTDNFEKLKNRKKVLKEVDP